MAKGTHFVLGFALGTVSALAAGVLLAPLNTKKLKEKVQSGVDEVGDRAADYFDYARDAASEFRSSAEEMATGLKTKLTRKGKPVDLDDYDEETAELRDAVIEPAEDDDESDSFDDIIVDGKSAFAQAKDEATPTAEDVEVDVPVDTPVEEAAPAAEDDTTDAE